jgi:hypothetical protein
MVRRFAADVEASTKSEDAKYEKLIRYIQNHSSIAPKDLVVRLSQIQVGEVQVETNSEHVAADIIGQAIVRGLGLTLEQVAAELDTYKDDWAAVGEPVDLAFLEVYRTIE